MIIVKNVPCPNCQHNVKVSVKQLPNKIYEVLFFDARHKNAKTALTKCPHCGTDLFQSENMKTLTGLETPQVRR
jgi:endogenous inhibitor of DNA gyrase (YacG/DUF329 family)